jgi:hypothetical protein
LVVPGHYRIRHDKIDHSGVVTLRHNSRLHHIGLGRRPAGTRVLVLVADLDVRVLPEDSELLRALTLNPSRKTSQVVGTAGFEPATPCSQSSSHDAPCRPAKTQATAEQKPPS